MVLDRTNLDLAEINVYRQLYWGKAELKLLTKSAGGYALLATLKRDWNCDEVLKDKTSDVAVDLGPRNVTFTIGDKKNTLLNILLKTTVFELKGKRYKITDGPNEPLDIRRIWKFGARYNDQDITPIVP